MKLSVIIVSYQVKAFLEQCLYSVQVAGKGMDMEVYVVDNNSTDGSAEMVKSLFPWVHCIENKENVGFSKANNQALALAKGAYLLLLNPDTVVPETGFSRPLYLMEQHSDWGALGIRMVDGLGNYLPESKRGIPTAWVSLTKMMGLARLFPRSRSLAGYYMGHLSPDQDQEVDILAGAYMMMRREAYQKVGGFDETFFMYGEDIDLSYRVQLGGYRNGYCASPALLHYKGESTKHGSLDYVKVFYEAMTIFVKKHFSSGYSGLFAFLIRLAIRMKATVAMAKQIWRKIWVPLMDATLLLAGNYYLTWYWEHNHRFVSGGTYPAIYEQLIIPGYVAVILLGLILRGAYARPVRFNRLLNGLLTGILLLIVGYALLPEDLRFSRALVGLSGLLALVVLPLWRRLGGTALKKPLMVFDRPERTRTLVVAQAHLADQALATLLKARPAAEYHGVFHAEGSLSTAEHRQNLLDTVRILGITEVVLTYPSVSFQEIIDLLAPLQAEGAEVLLQSSPTAPIIGSKGATSKGEVLDGAMQLAKQEVRAEKRRFDLVWSAIQWLFLPFNLLLPGGIRRLSWALSVVFKGYTWVGYPTGIQTRDLPALPLGLYACAVKAGLNTPDVTLEQACELYARHYETGMDVKIALSALFRPFQGARN